MSVAEQVRAVQSRVREAAIAAGREAESVTLVAATKVQSSETIREAITAGIRACGENRVQEFTAHERDGAYAGAKVHFIGHLQKNKIKYLVGHVDLIESVDSEELLRLVSERAEKLGIIQDVLIEVNIGAEENKSGVVPREAEELVHLAGALPGVRVRGLMAIPPVCAEPGGNRPYFTKMSQLFIDIKEKTYDNKPIFDCLSMGMSGDFEDAIACGATQVRVGTALFGARPPMRSDG